MYGDIFSYENINSAPQESPDELVISNPFIYKDSVAFSYLNPQGEIDAASHGRGWKLQISINEEDLAKAWLIVKDIFIGYKFTEVKILKKGYSFEKLAFYEQGKQITVYALYDLTRLKNHWQVIFEQITINLGRADIRPSFRPDGCAHIIGSNYLSYRNDYNPKEEGSSKQKHYLSAEDSVKFGDRAYNPFDKDDKSNPFKDIDVTAAVRDVKQPPIPERTGMVYGKTY